MYGHFEGGVWATRFGGPLQEAQDTGSDELAFLDLIPRTSSTLLLDSRPEQPDHAAVTAQHLNENVALAFVLRDDEYIDISRDGDALLAEDEGGIQLG